MEKMFMIKNAMNVFRQLSAMMADISNKPVEQVEGLFCNEVGYQTPKIDTRAAIFK